MKDHNRFIGAWARFASRFAVAIVAAGIVASASATLAGASTSKHVILAGKVKMFNKSQVWLSSGTRVAKIPRKWVSARVRLKEGMTLRVRVKRVDWENMNRVIANEKGRKQR